MEFIKSVCFSSLSFSALIIRDVDTHTLYLSALIPHDWNVLGEKQKNLREREPVNLHAFIQTKSHTQQPKEQQMSWCITVCCVLCCVVLCLTEFMCVSFRHQHTSRPQCHSRAQYHSSHHSERLQRSSTPDQRTDRLWDHLHQRDPSLPRCGFNSLVGELAKKTKSEATRIQWTSLDRPWNTCWYLLFFSWRCVQKTESLIAWICFMKL